MHIDTFAPQVTSVDALTNGEDGMGSKRRCHFENGGSMVEEVVKWEPDRGYRVRLSEMDPMPLDEAFAELSVAPSVPTARTACMVSKGKQSADS